MSRKKSRPRLRRLPRVASQKRKILLSAIERGFTRRRLNHYITYGTPSQRKAASELWKELFPHPEHHQVEVVDEAALTVRALPRQPPPKRIQLDHPEPFLAWLTSERDVAEPLDLESVEVAEVWGLVGLAALCLPESRERLHVMIGRKGDAARFAYAVGFNEIITGQQTNAPLEARRTVRLRRVTSHEEIDPTADDVSRFIVPLGSAEDLRLSIRYVLIELLRNVIQHSETRAGGVAAAQLMDRGSYTHRPAIQVTVADGGIGIPEHVGRMHKGSTDPRVALERALWPHISGTFPQGLTGSVDNAGLGLFFIAETAKRTDGRLLIASRGSRPHARQARRRGGCSALVPATDWHWVPRDDCGISP